MSFSYASQVQDLIGGKDCRKGTELKEHEWTTTAYAADDRIRSRSSTHRCHGFAAGSWDGTSNREHDPSKLVIDLEKIDENENGTTFIHTSPPGITTTEGPGATCESRIDTLFLNNSKPNNAYRLETFRSAGVFPDSPDIKDTEGRSVSDKYFLEKASENTLEIYQKIMWSAEQRYGPIMEVFKVEGSRKRRLVIGALSTFTLFTLLANTSNSFRAVSASSPCTSTSCQTPTLRWSNTPSGHEGGSLLFCLPENPFFLPKVPGTHAVQEATDAYCGWLFAQHFCNRLGPAYLQLKNVLDENDPAYAEVLNNIKRRFREETFTRESIEQIRLFHVNFSMVHYPASDHATELMPTLSYQRLQTIQSLSDEELYDKIRRTVPNKHSLQVLESFNKHILKTNLYQPTKIALSFRLDPGFLPEVEYPKKPFAMFFVIGNEFRGFHIRFKDVARGGIRIVMSRNKEMYLINQRMLFDENYNLASTQSLKNKDIPEGGAKGTILPSIGATPRLCFEKYVDAIVDLLIPEGTADMMYWAALHARDRGAETWWKSFTTGKSAETLGGVPHDTCGMTLLSIRQYVLGIYKQLGLKEKEITKVQTGGPDGDLGSNEILLSSDKTVTIIDGSGVLADPTGLDHEELVRLAKKCLTVANFDRTKLSKDGYLVKVEEQDVKLPSGEIVLDGTDFRNGAHLRFKADLPEAINISNMAALFDSEGKPHLKYIVEGANLFLTQQARLFLEKCKVVVFKDSSTNKGGVTSSSLEVLAGLALSTEEYVDLMIFKDGKPSEFYQSYVKDIQEKITENAAAEFHCLWKEHTRLQGAKPRTTISDELSSTLNNLQAELESSDLFEDVPSRKWGDEEGDTQDAG
ncbi:NAD(P)-binding protein [Gymnopus androsaceus JB14]|uniref:NAD(P)-binding protein n=1 Tax=Gymnopus androsaceus JB14 TaxID=1447944 RepID=A0A6A4GM10_9AGAR|nr:NAD(P)-binding protein [Gymnopus androsaceus JB14]